MQENEKNLSAEPRSKGRFYVTIISLLALFLLPFIVIAVTAFILPPVYSDTFVGELGDKYDRLCATEEPKIVVIGGSSVAFGLDSPMIEEHLSMPVVNFGLYANLGTKVMLDLSRAGIGEGDIVILAPEMNAQTLSLYFNNETTAQALDGNLDMLPFVDPENYESLVGALWKFASNKLGYLLSGTSPQNSGAYAKEWFNEQGDNTFPRPYNTMTSISPTISFDLATDSDGVESEYESFIGYVNDYVAFCRDVGATVYFSFAPMNEACLSADATEEQMLGFYNNLCASLNCRVISDIHDYVMDEGYFFDSEFHLNDSGVTVRTVRLIDDIKRERGITTVTVKNEELPEPSGYAPIDFEGESEENLYFVLEEDVNGAGQTVYYIVGLNELGKSQVNLVIPALTDGIPVAGIRRDALKGAAVRSLYLGINTVSVDSGAFGGAPNLSAVYVSKESPSQITIPNLSNPNGLATDGAPAGLKIYVPRESLDAFKVDYFWGDYNQNLVAWEK